MGHEEDQPTDPKACWMKKLSLDIGKINDGEIVRVAKREVSSANLPVGREPMTPLCLSEMSRRRKYGCSCEGESRCGQKQ